MTEDKVGMSKGRKVLIGLILTFVILAVGIYAGGVVYFQNHFLPKSRINGSTALFRRWKTHRKILRKP